MNVTESRWRPVRKYVWRSHVCRNAQCGNKIVTREELVSRYAGSKLTKTNQAQLAAMALDDDRTSYG